MAKTKALKSYKHTGDGVQIHLPSRVFDVEAGEIIEVSSDDAKVLDDRPDFEESTSSKSSTTETQEVSE